MKQKLLCVVALCLPFLVFSQHTSTSLSMTEQKGIKWAESLSWQQILKQAKKENKYIFVDCYATWCAPCKKMDKEVYTVDSVGTFFNSKYISLKVQMDSTKADNAATRSWYKTAGYLGKEYNITGYPTLLFFSPNGEIVSKELGYKDAGTFVKAARDAMDPSKQYYVLLRNYKKGKKDFAHMSYLLNTAKQLGDTATYRELLNGYYTYLHSLPKEKLYTKENIEFVASTLSNRNQVLFSMFYPDGKEVNTVMKNDWYAKKVVDQIIRKEKVDPFLSSEEGSSEPDWSILYNYIAKDYTDVYAGRNVLYAKVIWYISHNNYLKAATFLNDKVEKYGTDTTDLAQDFILINNHAGLLWADLEDITQLNRMIRWAADIVRRAERATNFYHTDWWPLYMDTYANMLHKVGRTTEAIKWQELALTKGRELNIGKGDLKLFENNLEKMKRGQPTWLP